MAEVKYILKKIDIIVDDREKDVYPCFTLPLSNAAKKGFNVDCINKRITTGDFVIMGYFSNEGEDNLFEMILAIFERKTWKDLAASISSRIKTQVENMKQAQEKRGADIYMIIEGNAYPHKESTCGRMPYGNLTAKIRHLLIRDKIPYLMSKDVEYTAELIVDMAYDYDKLLRNGDLEFFGERMVGSCEMKYLTTPHVVENEDIICKMWVSVPGISNAIMRMLREKYKLKDFILGKVSVEEVSLLKYPTGRSVGMRLAVKIVEGMKTKEVQMGILKSIKGIGKDSDCPKILLARMSFADLYDVPVAQIAEVQKSINRKIGVRLATRIKNLIEEA